MIAFAEQLRQYLAAKERKSASLLRNLINHFMTDGLLAYNGLRLLCQRFAFWEKRMLFKNVFVFHQRVVVLVEYFWMLLLIWTMIFVPKVGLSEVLTEQSQIQAENWLNWVLWMPGNVSTAAAGVPTWLRQMLDFTEAQFSMGLFSLEHWPRPQPMVILCVWDKRRRERTWFRKSVIEACFLHFSHLVVLGVDIWMRYADRRVINRAGNRKRLKLSKWGSA